MSRPTSNTPRKPLTNLPQPDLAGTRPPVDFAASCVKVSSPSQLVSPLQYMLNIINDATASTSRRDRLASVAARYCHPKPLPVGKKRRAAEAAKQVGGEWGDDLSFTGHRSQ